MEIFLLIVTIIILYVLFSWLTNKYAFTRLSYSRTPSRQYIDAGDCFTISIQVINNKLLPLPFIKICERIPREFEYEDSDNVDCTAEYNYHNSTMMLLPYQKITREYSIRCRSRGRYFFSNVKITAGDFWGLNAFSKNYENGVEMLVYPRIIHIDRLIVDYRNPMGDISVKRWIFDDPNIVMGIREYTDSDPFNKIHWPSSVKLNKLMVKNYDYTSTQRAILLLNIETSKPFWHGIFAAKIEKVIEIAASVSNELVNEGIATGIFTNADLGYNHLHESNYIEPSCGENQLKRILGLLTRITYYIQDNFDDILSRVLQSRQTGVRYIIVTPIIYGEMAELISSISVFSGVTVISLSHEGLELLPQNINIFTVQNGGIELEAV